MKSRDAGNLHAFLYLNKTLRLISKWKKWKFITHCILEIRAIWGRSFFVFPFEEKTFPLLWSNWLCIFLHEGHLSLPSSWSNFFHQWFCYHHLVVFSEKKHILYDMYTIWSISIHIDFLIMKRNECFYKGIVKKCCEKCLCTKKWRLMKLVTVMIWFRTGRFEQPLTKKWLFF